MRGEGLLVFSLECTCILPVCLGSFFWLFNIYCSFACQKKEFFFGVVLMRLQAQEKFGYKHFVGYEYELGPSSGFSFFYRLWGVHLFGYPLRGETKSRFLLGSSHIKDSQMIRWFEESWWQNNSFELMFVSYSDIFYQFSKFQLTWLMGLSDYKEVFFGQERGKKRDITLLDVTQFVNPRGKGVQVWEGFL